MNTSKSPNSILTNIIYPMVGPRCKTLDKHDFPDLEEDGRCLVCATYEEVDRAAAAIVEAVEGLAPKKKSIAEFPETVDTDWLENNPHDSARLANRNGYNKGVDDFLQAIKEWQ